MTVDHRALKSGDIIHVRGELRLPEQGLGRTGWSVNVGTGMVIVNKSDIVHAEPRPLKTNDTCIDKVTGWRGTIAAVDGTEAPNASAMRPKSPIMPLCHLERAEV
ncbi:hypothetical protein [Aurantimonas coralicida]|uniref:hypothetical protein n=1 Tax=Aurantimonas coralicida TaxID=182270 RepID=UPI001E5FC9A2|nr:hypothetical protein [Aurantimonas coralicida]MCD1645198.1 hypothetical protein [Aurantimonas coralicida]